MKFLEVPSLTYLSSCLNDIDTGDSIVSGRIECYTCKAAGTDKKLYKSLNKQYEVLSKSPEYHSELSVSPFGPLSLSTSRRTFISLISTLNASFPDYDFSELKPESFKKECNFHIVVNSINTILSSVLPDYQNFSAKMWRALDEEIRITECDIYSYIPDPDSDPFCEEGNIWCFNYFFFNRKLRKLIFLTCRAVSKMVAQSSPHSSTSTMIAGNFSDEENEFWTSAEYKIAEEMELEF